MNGNILSSGTLDLAQQDSCFCFVADGVGGNRAGEFAAEFVLRRIAAINGSSHLELELRAINTELVNVAARRNELSGTATTLTGLIARDDDFQIVHVGDSQMWLRRDGAFFKVTTDQVLNEYETNSPLTSYFGGTDNDLKFDTDIFVKDISKGDVFLICSDGLSKSLDTKTVKAILNEKLDLSSQAKKLLTECRTRGAVENISAILIQRTDLADEIESH